MSSGMVTKSFLCLFASSEINKSGDFNIQQTSVDGIHFLLSLPQTVLVQNEIIDLPLF